jgi:anti-sigma-K factor RskA
LPSLKGSQIYQGWLIAGKKPTSIGLLVIQNGFASVTYQGSIDQFDTAAVSLEPGPAASKNAPTGPVIASGQLRQANRVFITCSACG